MTIYTHKQIAETVRARLEKAKGVPYVLVEHPSGWEPVAEADVGKVKLLTQELIADAILPYQLSEVPAKKKPEFPGPALKKYEQPLDLKPKGSVLGAMKAKAAAKNSQFVPAHVVLFQETPQFLGVMGKTSSAVRWLAKNKLGPYKIGGNDVLMLIPVHYVKSGKLHAFIDKDYATNKNYNVLKNEAIAIVKTEVELVVAV